MASGRQDIEHAPNGDNERQHACATYPCCHKYAISLPGSCDDDGFASNGIEDHHCHDHHFSCPSVSRVEEALVRDGKPELHAHGAVSHNAANHGISLHSNVVSHGHANLCTATHIWDDYGFRTDSSVSNIKCVQHAEANVKGDSLNGNNSVGAPLHGIHKFEDKYCLDCNGTSDAIDAPTSPSIATVCSDKDNALHNMHFVACNCEYYAVDDSSGQTMGLCNGEGSATDGRGQCILRGSSPCHNREGYATVKVEPQMVEANAANGALHDQGEPETVACIEKAKAWHGLDSPIGANKACKDNFGYHELGCEPDIPVACNRRSNVSHGQESSFGPHETCIEHCVSDMECENDDEDKKHVLQGDDMSILDVLECETLSGEDMCVQTVVVSGNDDSSGKDSKDHTPNSSPVDNAGVVCPDNNKTLSLEINGRPAELDRLPSIKKKVLSPRDEAHFGKRGLEFIHSKRHGHQWQRRNTRPPLLRPSSFDSVPVKGTNGVNVWRAYANASFSTCVKLPSSHSTHTKNLSLQAPKKTVLSGSLSLPTEHQKASIVRQTPVPSPSRQSTKKNSAQSPPPSSLGCPSTSKCRPPLKPASLNVPATPNITTSIAPTSAAFARLIALPLVNAKAREEVRLDLRGQKVKSLDCNLVNLTAKLEFVYLRDNKLSHLAGIEILRRVKVLDLSFNEFKGLGMQPLASCKALQQLYLAGNQMTCLSSLPQLPNLEFLSVAQNKLKDLTMVTQPKLQVLAASKNKISTFKGFPHFPSLEHLRLEENPLSDMPHVEAAAILLAGPTLKRFNNLDITLEEQEIACMYPPHAGLCIRDGWEFCTAEKAYVSSFKFLVEKWVDRIPPGYALEQAYVEQPSEDYPCRCVFNLKKQSALFEDLEINFQYQWFIGGKIPSEFVPIEGSIQEVYWPKHEDIGHCLKVECILVVGDIEYAPTFAVSFPVLPGTGGPRVINLSVTGDFREGNMIYGNAEVAWCGGSATRGIVSWLRHDESCSPRMVPGAEEMEYLLSLDDVGAKLILMYTPLSKEGVKGEPRFATTDVIQAGFPSVTNLHIIGDLVEGNRIRGVGTYFGGKEGSSKFEWLQEVPESGNFQIASEGITELTLTKKDVGLRMMFQYTPVNSEGVEGIPVSIVTEKVAQAPPRVTSLHIVGELCEGSTMSICATIFSGGIEGASRVRWFKMNSPNKSLVVADMEEIGTSKSSENFQIPLGAFGFYLVAEYTPVLLDGLVGEPFMTVLSTPIMMLPPKLNFVSIKGEHKEGETLTASYSYVGGKEGSSQFIWCLHGNDSDPGSPIVEAAGLLEYTVTKAAINKFVSFKCIPVRDDGYVGDEKSVMGQRRVQPGFPKLISLEIVGNPKEGSHMQIVKSYIGGLEGSPKIQWFQMNSIGNLKKIEGATSHTYTSTTENVDSYLCVSYEPCRSDGVAGSVVVSQPFGPVSPGLPMCEDIKLCGQTVEGEHLSFTAVYRGGVKGACTCQWIREQAYGVEKKLSVRDTLRLTLEDVGCCIKLVYTPVRKDGVSGVSKKIVSDVIKAGEPTAIRLIVPNGCQDVEMIPQKSFFGGVEGDNEFTWFRLADRLEGLVDFSKSQAVGRSERYTPNLEDVGSYLALLWVPIRKDGKQGKPCLACSSQKVAAAPPLVQSVIVKRISPNVFVGEGIYYGGVEGESETRWYRQASDGVTTPIPGASSRMYTIKDDDYTHSLVFGYTPVRQDGVVGKLLLSAPTEKILPEVPRLEKLVMSGKAIEGELLTVAEEIPNEEIQQHVWRKYIKEVKYQWSRSVLPAKAESFETLTFHRNCSYTIRTEDIGYFVQCECVVMDTFGRSSTPVSVISSPILAGIPKVEKLEIEGQGYHSDIYAIRGIYNGGKEGKSVIQWFRAMARGLELVPITGVVGRMYEANVEDVGYRLVAVYTPVRDDGIEGTPVSTSTHPIKVELAIAKEVKEKLELGSLRFEALLSRDPSTAKFHSNQGLFEKRIVDVNKRRLKAMKPGPKTFLGTELRFSFPFHVEANKSDQHRLKITKEGESKIELMVQSMHIRDLVVLTIKGLKLQI